MSSSHHAIKYFIEIDSKMLVLKESKSQVEVEKAAFESHKQSLIRQCRTEALSTAVVDSLAKQANAIDARLNRISMDLNSLILQKNILLGETSATFERIIVGAGIAGTAVFIETSNDLSDSGRFSAESDLSDMPSVIVLNDPSNDHQWRKDGEVLMGQPANIQVPPIFSVRSVDFTDGQSTSRNPYNYVMANHFDQALLANQSEIGMKILNAAAIALDSKDSYVGQVPWEHDGYPNRISIEMSGRMYYLYAQHIDLCTGPGPSRKLSDKQIEPALAQKLDQSDKVIYGQNWGDKKLQGNVVFYGGGARNAAMILDILNGYHLLVTGYIWIARNGEDFDTNEMFNRMFKDLDADPRCKMALGELVKVDQRQDGQLILNFGPPQKVRKHKRLMVVNNELLCDQMVVSMGQDVYPLIKKLKGFVPCVIENNFPGIPGEIERIPLGTHSPDKSIIAWGAAGAMGTGLDDAKQFNEDVLKHAQTLPRESRATVGIFRSAWTIKMMTIALQQRSAYSLDPHSWDLPDINMATRKELFEWINCEIFGQAPEESLKIVDHILEIRSKHPTGLDNISILATEIPPHIFLWLKKIYAFFDVYPVQTPALPKPLAGRSISDPVKVSSSADTLFGKKARHKSTDEFSQAIALLHLTASEDMLLPRVDVVSEAAAEKGVIGFPSNLTS